VQVPLQSLKGDLAPSKNETAKESAVELSDLVTLKRGNRVLRITPGIAKILVLHLHNRMSGGDRPRDERQPRALYIRAVTHHGKSSIVAVLASLCDFAG
jgi:hypothetical protein